jgi:hypothetical protein
VKSGKKDFISTEIIASWLERAASGNETLTSVIPTNVDKKHRLKTFNELVNPFSLKDCIQVTSLVTLLGGVSSVLIDLIVAGSIAPSLNTSSFNLSFMGSFTFLSGAGFASFALPAIKKKTDIWSQLKEIQSHGTKAWLSARYAIQVSELISNQIAESILFRRPNITFADVHNQLWTLQVNPENTGFLVQPSKVALEEVVTPAQFSQAPIMVSVGAKDLPAEVQSVVDQVDARLSQLHQFALTTEEAHIVSRAVKDAQEAVMTFEQLRILGAETSGVSQLIDVMKVLLSELEGIVNKKAAEVNERFAAQQVLVNARQGKVGV